MDVRSNQYKKRTDELMEMVLGFIQALSPPVQLSTKPGFFIPDSAIQNTALLLQAFVGLKAEIDKMGEFIPDPVLQQKIDRFKIEMEKDSAIFKAQMDEYNTAISTFNDSLSQSNPFLVETQKVGREELLANIKRKIDEADLEVQRLTNATSNHCLSFFCCFSSEDEAPEVINAKQKLNNLKEDYDALIVGDEEKEKRPLLNYAHDKIAERDRFLENVKKNKPREHKENQKNYITLMAKLESDRSLFYSSFTDHAMLYLVRIYMLIEAKESSMQNGNKLKWDDSLQKAQKIKKFFLNFISKQSAFLSFQSYLSRCRQLNADDQKKLLEGSAPLELIKKAFTFYEAEEAEDRLNSDFKQFKRRLG